MATTSNTSFYPTHPNLNLAPSANVNYETGKMIDAYGVEIDIPKPLPKTFFLTLRELGGVLPAFREISLGRLQLIHFLTQSDQPKQDRCSQCHGQSGQRGLFFHRSLLFFTLRGSQRRLIVKTKDTLLTTSKPPCSDLAFPPKPVKRSNDRPKGRSCRVGANADPKALRGLSI